MLWPIVMLVLTKILIIWSIIKRRITKRDILKPLEIFISSICSFHSTLNAECSVGHKPESLLGYQFAGNTADTVGFIFDADKGILEVLYELILTRSQLARFFLEREEAPSSSTLKVGMCLLCRYLCYGSQRP